MIPSPELIDCWRAFQSANAAWHQTAVGSAESARAAARHEEAKTLLAHTLDAELRFAELMGEIPAPAPMALQEAA